MNVKKIVPLIGALALGLVAARMVVRLIQSNKAPEQTAAGPRIEKVIIAAHDVSAGSMLADDDLDTTKLAVDSAPAGAFTDSTAVVGRVSAVSLAKGQTIVDSWLAPKGTAAGLQAVIPSGMRAFTIDVNEISGVAGYITPGCRVDIVQTLHDATTNQPVARCVAQNVEVTAVGTRQAAGALDIPHSVTLLVTPLQAETIELASSNGRPRLVLRSAADKGMPDISSVTLSDLTGEPTPVSPISNLKPQPALDPFAPTTRPSESTELAAKDQWRMRIVSAGQESVVNVPLPTQTSGTAVTGTSDGSDK